MPPILVPPCAYALLVPYGVCIGNVRSAPLPPAAEVCPGFASAARTTTKRRAEEGCFVTRPFPRDRLEGAARALARQRVRVALALGVLVFVIAAVLLPRLSLGSDEARRMLVGELQRSVGGTVLIDGPVSFSLLPKTRISADRLRMDGAGTLRIERVVADLDPVDALFGKASISRLVLIRPEYHSAPATKAAAPDPVQPAEGPRATAERLLAQLPHARTVDIRQGVFRSGRGGGRPSGLSNANIVINRSAVGDGLDASGSFVWNGDTTTVRITLGSKTALMNGGSSSVDLEMTSPTLDASFDGDASLDRNGGITGRVRLESPSLSRSIEWLANPGAAVPDVGAVSVAGDLVFAGVDASLQNADVRIAGSSGRGALEARILGDRPTVGGTLAFGTLDLTPLVRSLAPLPNDPFDLARHIDVGFSHEIGLDLRLSAERATLGALAASDVAAALLVADGKATIDVNDAVLLGGHGQASIVVDANQAPPQASGHLALAGVDTPSLFAALDVDVVGVSGRSDISADMTAPVTDWGSIVRNIQFDTRVTTRNGVLTGFDPDVFRRPGARALIESTSGATVPFAELEARLVSFGPRIHLREFVLAGSAGTVRAAGVMSVLTRELRIRGTFDTAASMTASTTGEFTTSKPVAFTMAGHWPNPDVTSR
ncbi:AsmA-like C-terminal region-containing protein [Aurantimonas sp. HBX-1]|uniref:AsmA family protein n=1 Tax=Aurantimonas sp. HBX-1 TaxID=2906072 RepID=UPI001F2C4527|nr:AsmA-like C-terminal region-containing protein [Aurantimonas sp. HBX-1]UIJ71309.1 AsmA family protein [Aurantimonas sp. HBX-1]